MKSLIPEEFKNLLKQNKLKIFVFAVILAFYASFLIVKIELTAADNDAGLYISDGKIIWETKTVFRTNVYSYTVPDYPVYDHHWLSSLTFFFTHKIFGFEGLTILKTLVLLTAFSILFLAALKKADFWLVAVLSFPVILMLTWRTRIRPEMFSYLFLASMLYFLFDLEKNSQSKKIFWLIPLQLLWVNFHLYFFVGIAIAGGFLFEKIVLHVPWRFWKTRVWNIFQDVMVRKMIIVLVAMIAVCFVNPNGIEGALAPFKTHSYTSFTVSENQPLFNLKASFLSWNIANSTYMHMVFIFFISLIFGFRSKNKPIFFLLVGIGSAAAGLIHLRLVTLFAVIFLLAAASNLNEPFLKAKSWIKRKWPQFSIVLGYSFIIIIASFFPYKIYSMHLKPAATQGYQTSWGVGLSDYSNAAGEFFKREGVKGPIFNDYDIGGYILYHLFPEEKVFVDNNGADSYPVEFFDHIFMPALSDEDAWQAVQDQYGINSIFISLRDGSPAVGRFLWRRLHDPQWALIYFDTYNIILVRNIIDNKEVIDKFYNPKHLNDLINPLMASDNISNRIVAGRLLYLLGNEKLSTSVLKKVVAEYPENSWVWLYMGSIKVWNNNSEDLISSLIFLENAVNLGSKTAEGYTWLGLAYFRSGRFEKAEEAFQKALWLDPGRYDTTNYLNQIQEYLNK